MKSNQVISWQSLALMESIKSFNMGLDLTQATVPSFWKLMV